MRMIEITRSRPVLAAADGGKVRKIAACAFVATLVLAATAPAVAKVTSIKLLQAWSGRLPLNLQPPFQSSLATPEDLAPPPPPPPHKGDTPKVDFQTRLVLLAVRRGSVVKFTDLKLDDGNLKSSVVVTPDMPAHMTCAIVLIDRAGVTKVNGLPIGQ